MTALDVISLVQAKEYLVVTFPDHDGIITTAIGTAVSWVETYTGYRLYERTIDKDMIGCRSQLYEYPIEITTVKDPLGNVTDFSVCKRTLSIIVDSRYGSSITAKVGYATVADIPEPLLSACYKLITYLYENRDAYGLTMPVDIQGLINQLRRDATI